METYWMWWMAAVVLVIAEMLSGTFYLLAVAFGMAVGGIAAYLGGTWGVQIVSAALLCTVSVAGIHLWKQRQPKHPDQSNFAYDIGQAVNAMSWSDERHARVSYRGAEWDAELAGQVQPDTARLSWRIKEIKGSRLIIE